MKKYHWPRPVSVQTTLDRFMQHLGMPEKRQIIELWRHWSMVMGHEIASIAWPLGSKNNILMVGGEDALSLQEISYMQFEILERANAFMGKEYFNALKVSLSLDKTPLNVVCQHTKAPSPNLLPHEVLHGEYLKDMPATHPVARCYAHYVHKSHIK